MKTPLRWLLLTVGMALALGPVIHAADPATRARKKVLFFSKSSGFEHEAIKLVMKDGKPGYAFAVLREIGEKQNIEFTFSKDGSLFTPDYLARFDAFFFYTTGDLTLAKNSPVQGDGNPPMTAAGKAAFLQAIVDGKGFIGTHSAADTFHPPGNKEHGPARNVDDGDKLDDYTRTRGASFIRHAPSKKDGRSSQTWKRPGFLHQHGTPGRFLDEPYVSGGAGGWLELGATPGRC